MLSLKLREAFVILLIVQQSLCIRYKLGPCRLHYMEPCSSEVIQFFMFSSYNENQQESMEMDIMDPRLPNWVNMTYPTKLIIHGYGGHLDYNATKYIRDAYLENKDTNVIVVDWGNLARLPCYPTAAFNTRQAGECIANIIIGLGLSYPDFKAKDVHVVGFSLGAHVAGFASNSLEDATGVKFHRITGLDPALPFFAASRSTWKLDKGDADFVDVIHTNAGIYGKIEPTGHIDYYVNGGRRQPACKHYRNVPLCSHMLATAYFAESINTNDGFWGIVCGNYLQYFLGFCDDSTWFETPRRQFVLMGEHCQNSIRGVVLVDTHDRPPYAVGKINT